MGKKKFLDHATVASELASMVVSAIYANYYR